VINKLNLLTNATVVEDAITVIQLSKDMKLKLLSSLDKEESKEFVHNNDQLVEEKQETKTTEIQTTNQVF
jgi:hypothetical protein